MPTTTETELRLIPLKSIAPSPTNQRKTFDEAGLAQLAESIRSKGVLEPILLRPWKPAVAKLAKPDKTVPGYEIIVGERRWRAAQKAELKVIPALVRAMDDRAAAECQVIENDQREDVAPLEQARGYERLIALGDDVKAIAATIGRPPRYVFARLQLTKLIAPLQEDLEQGRIAFGHAHLLARLSPRDQADARENHLFEDNWSDDPQDPIPVHVLRDQLHRGYVHDLAGAAWKLDDAALLPAAGPCTTCPKRRGHNPHLFEELLNGDAKKKADYCLDGTCFHEKADALIQLGIRAAKADAGEEPVLVTTDFFRSATGGFASAAVLTSDKYDVLSAKEAKAATDAKPAVIVGGDGVGKVISVRVKPEPKPTGTSLFNAEQNHQRQKGEIARRAALTANGLVAAKTAAACGFAFSRPLMKLTRALITVLTGPGHAEACRAVARRRNLPLAASKFSEAVAELAAEIDTGAELLALLAEVIAADRSALWSSYPVNQAADNDFWNAFGIDRTALIRQAAAADKVKPKKTAKGTKRAKARA